MSKNEELAFIANCALFCAFGFLTMSCQKEQPPVSSANYQASELMVAQMGDKKSDKKVVKKEGFLVFYDHWTLSSRGSGCLYVIVEGEEALSSLSKDWDKLYRAKIKFVVLPAQKGDFYFEVRIALVELVFVEECKEKEKSDSPQNDAFEVEGIAVWDPSGWLLLDGVDSGDFHGYRLAGLSDKSLRELQEACQKCTFEIKARVQVMESREPRVSGLTDIAVVEMRSFKKNPCFCDKNKNR